MWFRVYFSWILLLVEVLLIAAFLIFQPGWWSLALLPAVVLLVAWMWYLTRWETWLKAADRANREGRFDEAQDRIEDALSLANRYGPDDLRRAIILNGAAELYRFQDRFDEAERCHQRALALRERLYPPHHLYVAESLNNLANVYLRRGKWNEAEPLYRQALAIIERRRGTLLDLLLAACPWFLPYRVSSPWNRKKRDLMIAICLNNLGVVYFGQHRYADAESFCRQSLALCEKRRNPGARFLCTVLNSLALACGRLGRHGEAERLARRALAIAEKTWKPETVERAACFSNLAEVYRLQGRNEEAAEFAEDALAIREQILGPDHLSTAWTLNVLAQIDKAQGDYERAAALCKRVLTIRERVLAPDHPDLLESLEMYADLLRRKGEAVQATPVETRIHEIRSTYRARPPTNSVAPTDRRYNAKEEQ
jgi:tetratricopeptide (TPR) repeat protein